MYHPKKLVNLVCLAASVCLYLNQSLAIPVSAKEEKTAEAVQLALSPQAGIESTAYPLIPLRRDCRGKPDKISIYQCDSQPLGDRMPFLLVHGLRGEYYHGFRWDALIRHFQEQEQFSRRYKLYLARYDSLACLAHTVPLMKEAIARLYSSADKRPLNVMALSIGGNLVYESMLDPATDSKVKLLITLGTPFHGSPLFCPIWFKYSLYKNRQLPWTRIDHTVAYRLYFNRNPNLLKDFGWDNCDQAIPNIGRFRSFLPLGPSGDLTAEESTNKAFSSLAEQGFDRKKLVVYSCYLLNPYLRDSPPGLLKGMLAGPYDFSNIEAPAHLGREEPVLKMLDRQIAQMRTNSSASKRAGTCFVYGLNDGITPLASALFLSSKVCQEQSLAKESDIAKIKNAIDVRTARVFRNVDHLAFIGGAKPPPKIKGTLSDQLNPTAGSRNLFDWMLWDIEQCNGDIGQIAKQDQVIKSKPPDRSSKSN